MNIKTIKTIVLSAAAALSVTSCATTGQSAQSGAVNAAGTAAVDAATKNNPIAGEAIRSATGLGTSPVEKAKTGLLGGLGL